MMTGDGVSVLDHALYRDQFGSPEMRALFTAEASVRRWLEVEVALARAEAAVGIVPEAAAREIARAAEALAVDWPALERETALVGYPILPLVRQLAAACAGDAGGYVHWGATTQDIMDTAVVLQCRDALAVVERDLARLEAALADLARRHRDTVMAGRTHGQHALPITFGYKVAVWVAEVRRHRARCRELAPRLLVGQLAGAAGTLASLGTAGEAVQRGMMAGLGLDVPPIAWHVARDGLAELAAVLGMVCATGGKLGQEVALLARTEIGELEEGYRPGRGASSTMPQKRNPITSELLIAIARIARQEVGLALDAMAPDHERATGPWHLEWACLPALAVLAGGALGRALDLVGGLTVRPDRMAENLARTDGLIVAEAAMMALAPRLGRQRAHDVVSEACGEALGSGRRLADVLAARPEVAAVLSPAAVAEALDPRRYTGLAARFVDRVVGEAPGAPAREAPDA